MHIGIVELCEKNHHSMIFNWVKIANLNKWKITLFTTKEIFKKISYRNTTEGVIAVAKSKLLTFSDLKLGKNPLI